MKFATQISPLLYFCYLFSHLLRLEMGWLHNLKCYGIINFLNFAVITLFCQYLNMRVKFIICASLSMFIIQVLKQLHEERLIELRGYSSFFYFLLEIEGGC